MRFKTPAAVTLPNKYSTSANFWLYAADSDVPWSEIDIFEMRARDNHYTNNIHYTHAPDPPNVPKHNQLYEYGAISANAWHVAACLWTSTEITFYLDGAVIKTLDPNQGIRPDSLLPMQIDIGTGGPAAAFCEIFDPTYSQDYSWQIDYVKVYQMQQDCNTAKTYCNNFNSAVSKLYQSVTLDGSTCVDAITNATYTSIYGENYVTVDAGFSIDNNSTVIIDVRDCTSSVQYHSVSPQPVPASYRSKSGALNQ